MKRASPLDVDRVAEALALQTVAAIAPLLKRIEASEAREQALLARIAELEARKMPEMIKGDPGPPGRDGIDGKDGAPGRDGTNGEKGDPGERGLQGDPGRDGQPGRDGRDGAQGLTGKDGLNGKDGADGKDGRDGINGKDGLGWDDIGSEEIDERTTSIRMRRGDDVKEVLRIISKEARYRQVYKEGQTYKLGDLVTWAGSTWHCNAETDQKPGDGSPNWTLMVKKGRDGRDGELKPPKPNEPIKLK